MNLVPLLILVALLQAQPALFEIEVWPGEGRPMFEATSGILQLRDEPSTWASIVRVVSVSPNEKLTFDDTRYRTIEAGRLTTLLPTRITGRMLGAARRLSREDYYKGMFATAGVDLQAGANLEYLQYRAEGMCFIGISGNVIDADACPANDRERFRLESEPKTEWWIHVVLPNDTAGWVLVADGTVKLVKREF